MDQAVTKGRKPTFEARIEIVRYCLENARNYQRMVGRLAGSYRMSMAG